MKIQYLLVWEEESLFPILPFKGMFPGNCQVLSLQGGASGSVGHGYEHSKLRTRIEANCSA